VTEDGADLGRPRTIILLVETLDLGGELLLAVVFGRYGRARSRVTVRVLVGDYRELTCGW
jgi:hypothetical protein